MSTHSNTDPYVLPHTSSSASDTAACPTAAPRAIPEDCNHRQQTNGAGHQMTVKRPRMPCCSTRYITRNEVLKLVGLRSRQVAVNCEPAASGQHDSLVGRGAQNGTTIQIPGRWLGAWEKSALDHVAPNSFGQNMRCQAAEAMYCSPHSNSSVCCVFVSAGPLSLLSNKSPVPYVVRSCACKGARTPHKQQAAFTFTF